MHSWQPYTIALFIIICALLVAIILSSGWCMHLGHLLMQIMWLLLLLLCAGTVVLLVWSLTVP
jgi:hypothetical protein